MIAIINYGSGNIRAIGNIYDRLKIPYFVADSPHSLSRADKIILPGVGAFDETIRMLNYSGFKSVLDELVLEKKMPVIGICVGMQILAKGSEEGKLEGLGWIDGYVKKLNKDFLKQKPKLPHLGWNSIKIKRTSSLLKEIDEEKGFYFLHSYYFECSNQEDILTTSEYGIEFASSINSKNIFGAQFHPEKSHHNGITLLKNFAAL
jgi:glutamine amidotransferase